MPFKTAAPSAEPAEQPATDQQESIPYQLPLLRYEERTVDKGRASFSGSIDLLTNSALDVDVMTDLKIGTRVRLTVVCYVANTGAGAPRDKEGVIKEVVKKMSLKVESLSDVIVLERL